MPIPLTPRGDADGIDSGGWPAPQQRDDRLGYAEGVQALGEWPVHALGAVAAVLGSLGCQHIDFGRVRVSVPASEAFQVQCHDRQGTRLCPSR